MEEDEVAWHQMRFDPEKYEYMNSNTYCIYNVYTMYTVYTMLCITCVHGKG